jgi:site-specific DNA-methyltransferase (adenine-specific)
MLKYQDDLVTLYCGDCRDYSGATFDVAIADPPYGETSLDWDVWPDGWLDHVSTLTRCVWLFCSLRVLLSHAEELSSWRFAQDVVWEKHNGSSSHADRFRRVHENVVQLYRGEWAAIHREPQYTLDATARTLRSKSRPPHWGKIGESAYASEDGGPRLARSVQRFRSCHGSAENETQKPVELVKLLIAYSCPPEGIVFSPFAGSGTDLVAAKALGRRAVGVERREDQCAAAVARLSQQAMVLA